MCGHRVLVFDFDQTLITAHSGGDPSRLAGSDPFLGQREELKATLRVLKSAGAKLYISSRGLGREIADFVAKMLFPIPVYGAADAAEISPWEDASQSTRHWARRKVEFLNQIAMTERVPKDCVFFFDDTEENVQAALDNGFRYSFLVNRGDRDGLVSTAHVIQILQQLPSLKTIPNLLLGAERPMVVVDKKAVDRVFPIGGRTDIRAYIVGNGTSADVESMRRNKKDLQVILKDDLAEMQSQGVSVTVSGKPWSPAAPMPIGAVLELHL